MAASRIEVKDDKENVENLSINLMALGSLCSFPVRTHLIQKENYGRIVFRHLTLLNHSKKVCLSV